MRCSSLHANVAVHAEDRPRLERLARYCARPPICMERLERLADGRLLYRFKRPWRDGTTHIVLEPLEMLEKLAALVPAPKAHLVRYSGLLAPAAKWRSRIVPESSSSSAIESPALTDTAAMNAEWTGLLRIHAKSGGSVAPVADGEWRTPPLIWSSA